MNLLITGCAGFIGFHLTKRMLQDGHKVVGIDNMNAYYDPTLKYARLALLKEMRNEYNFQFMQIDVENTTQIQNLFASNQFDTVCHLATQTGARYSAENPQQYISTNIQGTFNILEICRNYPHIHLIYASSSSVYGAKATLPYSETQTTDQPSSLHAATLKSGELMAHAYSELYGIKTTGLRFFTVYGPWGRPDMTPSLFANAIIHHNPIELYNNGDIYRDFTYIDDVINGMALIIKNHPLNEQHERANIYNIGHSSPVHLRDFVYTLEQSIGIKALTVDKPMQSGDALITWADVSHLQNDYGYIPRISLKEGIQSFIRWYKEYTRAYQIPKTKNICFHLFS